MSLRISRTSNGHKTTLVITGHVRSGDIQEVQAQMDLPRRDLRFDLKEVTLVDLDTIHFLGACESEGVELLNCAPYIREWISRERTGEEG